MDSTSFKHQPSIKKGKKKVRGQGQREKAILEKRKHPRWSVDLPLDYSRKGKKSDYGGVVKNASESGILVYLPEEMALGENLKVEIFFAKGLQLDTVRGIAKIVWADFATRETFGEHRYGLEFHSMPKGMMQKLKNLLQEVKNTHPSP